MFTKSTIIVLIAISLTSKAGGECLTEILERIEEKIDANTNTLAELLDQTQDCCREYSSCSEILERNPSAPSGEYTLTINGGEVTVYCEMESDKCGLEKGWARVAYYDIASGDDCPEGLYTYTRSDKKLCDRLESTGCRCDSAFFDTKGISYSKVCGRVRGYQNDEAGYVDGIYPNNANDVDDLNTCYVDGVSITRGDPREHVWTFANGVLENRDSWTDCPCNTGSTTTSPSYVGSDYYCESATSQAAKPRLYLDDPLWDGELCRGLESPCCSSSTLPYFVRDLGEASTTEIELRMCSSEGLPDESIPLDLIEIYIK